jgi:hypothetical protein
VGGSYGPPKTVTFTTLKLPTYNTGNIGTVTRTNSPNGVDSVWTFKDGNNVDFNLFSDICLNVISVGTGSSSVLNPNTTTYITGGGGGQVIYKDQFRVYNYYQRSPSIDSSYNLSIVFGNSTSPGSISLDINSSFATTPNIDDPFFTGVSFSNGIDGNSILYNGADTTFGGNDSTNAGGGGAGTNGNGFSASSNIGGNGGPGIGFTINNVVYGPYGGGGGGYGSVQTGLGGIGGGGNAGTNGNGVPNTGGGAGGSNSTTIQNQGGSGAVVIVGTTSLLPSVISGLSYGNTIGNGVSYSVDISYNQSVNNVTGYGIKFNGNVINTITGNIGNSFVINSPTILTSNYKGLNGGNAYTISAYTTGTYGNSAIGNITIPPFTLPPTNLTQIYPATSSNTIAFSFTAPTTPVTYYSATAIDGSGNVFTNGNISFSSNTASITGLSVATLYTITMNSFNSYGKSISSNAVSFSTFDKISTLNNTITCTALDISNNYLYVGGSFTTAGSKNITANCIARWNTITNTWSDLPNNPLSSTSQPFALLLINKILYISSNDTTYGLFIFDTSNNTWTKPSYSGYNSIHGFNAMAYSNSSSRLYIGHGPKLLYYDGGNNVNDLNTPGNTGGAGAPGPMTMGMVLNDSSKNLYIVYNNCTRPFAIYNITNNTLIQYTSTNNFFTGICFDSSQNIYISAQRLNINGNTYTDGICYFNTNTNTFSALVNGGSLQSTNQYYKPAVLGVINDKLIIGTIFGSNSSSPFCRIYDIKTKTMSVGVNGLDANNDVRTFAYDKTTSYIYFGGAFTTAPGGDTTSPRISRTDYFFPPTGLTAISNSTSSITISYIEPYSAISTYTVTAVPTPSGNTITQTYNAPASSYVITGLTSGTTYNITLKATNYIGKFVNITTSCATVSIPVSPSGLNVAYSNSIIGVITISYNNVSNATSYYISISPYNPNILSSSAKITSDNSFNTTNINNNFVGFLNNTNYTISVFASNLYGNSSITTTTFNTNVSLTITGGLYITNNPIINGVSYTYYMLYSTGVTYTISQTNFSGSVNVLAVGGGGGGGFGCPNYNVGGTFYLGGVGGGGGGGGVVDTNLNLPSQISVIIGAGGLNGNGTRFPTNGSNTIVGTITAYGGGAGGSTKNLASSFSNATTGGSGGGGYAKSTSPASTATNNNGASGNTNANNKANAGGGSYINVSAGIFCGGGGGGAGSVGASAINANQVQGGSGYTYNLTGNTVSRGGSGGAWNSSNGADGTNSGDGGGGGGGGPSSAVPYIGGNGASGVVILSYVTSFLPSLITGLSNGNLTYDISTNTNGIDISFNKSVNNIVGYNINFYNSANTTDNISCSSGTKVSGNTFIFNTPDTTTYTFTGLNTNKTYYANVYAIGTYGNTVSSQTSFNTTVFKNATGGSIIISGGYKIHTFTYTGSNQSFIVQSGITSVNILVVGGGGGGGSSGLNIGYGAAGGGGGGMVKLNSNNSISNGTYIISVGNGGAGGTVSAPTMNSNNNAKNGGNSSISGTSINIVALGGGYGGIGTGVQSTVPSGNSGGNGGGAGAGSTTSGSSQPLNGGSANGGGNNGGNGYYSKKTPLNKYFTLGGGGGGAGQIGGSYSGSDETYYPGNGGNGVSISIGGNTTYYGGGGGGSGYLNSTSTTYLMGTGGLGGGGNAGSVGVANTGGGGGAMLTGSNSGSPGFAGGSGVVIVYYTYP